MYSINLMSLSCCVILNLNCTRCPILVVDCVILTSKQPSPATNPAIQLGSGIFSVKNDRSFYESYFIKLRLKNKKQKKSDKPQFIDALILSIFINPSIDR